MVITMAKLRMAHASTHGARKPPGPTVKVNLNNGQNTTEKYSEMNMVNKTDELFNTTEDNIDVLIDPAIDTNMTDDNLTLPNAIVPKRNSEMSLLMLLFVFIFVFIVQSVCCFIQWSPSRRFCSRMKYQVNLFSRIKKLIDGLIIIFIFQVYSFVSVSPQRERNFWDSPEFTQEQQAWRINQ